MGLTWSLFWILGMLVGRISDFSPAGKRQGAAFLSPTERTDGTRNGHAREIHEILIVK